MPQGRDVSFGPFRLDTTNECLWQGPRAISLRPKAFAVLRLLLEHPGQLVTKRQVMDAVWPGTFVGDAVLKDSIRQLREALGDDADAPAYIETAHRRGYRFIGHPWTAGASGGVPADHARPSPAAAETAVLGREVELGSLRASLDRALTGERQLVFVTGEAGIGKTSLVEALLRQAETEPDVLIARGQCLEHFGAGEAYMPVLEGFSRLGRTSAGARTVDLLREHAPAWLAQMPSLVPPAQREAAQAHALGATRERMLREMAEAIEAITSEATLLLVLEDLHWSDFSTLDLVSYLARRRDPAGLMVIGTYRPVEVTLGDHPLKAVKRELQAHDLCRELPLGYLTEEATAEYLAVRFPGHQFSRRLARMMHQRTGGNPLFMVNVADYLVAERMVVAEDDGWNLRIEPSQTELGVPQNLSQLIERQIERLTEDERTVLDAASVVGMECSSVAIAAGLDRPTEWVERHCEELARRHQFLSPAWLVELPDGTITPRHKFNHVLYLEVPYGLVPPLRRAQIHHRVAEKGVVVYGDRVGEIAAELAMHFEQSRDWPRALEYLTQAAANAAHRSAHHEATDLAGRGLEVLKSLPDSPDRAQQEITLRMTLGVSLMAIKGFAAAEVEQVYSRARELCWQQPPSPQLFSMLWSLGLYYVFKGEMAAAVEIADQLLQLANGLEDPPLVMEAHRAMGVTLLDHGRHSEALEHLDKATSLYGAHRNHRYMLFIGHDCKVVCDCFAARALWALGHPDQAAKRMEAALGLARQLGHPQTLVIAAHFAAQLHQLRGEAAPARERAAEVVSLADECGLQLWLAFGHIDLGWAEVEMGRVEGGIAQMQRGLAAYEATGARLWRPHFLGLLAAALSRSGQPGAARRAVQEAIALAEGGADMYSTPELHRIRGELLAASGETAEAERSLQRAIAVARQKEARSWELRSATTLAGLDLARDRRVEARRAMAEIHAWFTEGHDTQDLRRARAALGAVSPTSG